MRRPKRGAGAPAEPPADSAQSLTPYQLTLAAFAVPWRKQALLNIALGIAFATIVGPVLALAWTLCLCAADWSLQRIYRRLSRTAASADSRKALIRMSGLLTIKAAAWFVAPTVFTAVHHSVHGMAFVFVMGVALSTLAVSSARNSRAVYLAMSAPILLAIAVSVVGALGFGPGAGVLLATAILAGVLWIVATGTNRAVGEWNQATHRASRAFTEMKVALERSEAAERRVRMAVEIADLYVYEIDYVHRTVVTLGDDTALFDRPFTYEEMDRDPYRMVLPQDRPAVQAAWARHKAGEGPYQIEYRMNRSDGRVVWVYATAEMIRDSEGRRLKMVGALQNITGRKTSELELIEARDRAEAANEAKSEFLATMSHEIRTPLNGVLGMAQAMEADHLSPGQRGRVEVIRSSGEVLLTLLNSILDLSKLEAGKLELEDGEVDVETVARGALQAFSGEATGKGIELVLDVAPRAGGVYAGDPTRVGQVLYNLVSNAVKFTEQGSVRLIVDRPTTALVIRVEDSGIGIAPEQQDTLFDKFVQADASVTRRYGGSGLGLAICRELVDRMGGAIGIASTHGQGSVFTVTLPLPWLRDSHPRAETPQPAPSPASDGRDPLKVLIAEDNPTNQLVLRSLLEPAGIVPILVVDGQQALAAWRAEPWDIILMDIQMPVMDGVSATLAIRDEEASSGRAHTPIVGITANIMAHQLQSYRTAGMDDVVAKPIEVPRLFAAIEAALCDEPTRPLQAA